MVVVLILGLLSSLFYGASDFLGALTARRLTVLKASVAVYAAATATAGVALAFVPWSFGERALWSGIAAGVLATVGMVTFYAALAIGPMSLLAPLIALIQTAIPVAVSATTGSPLSPIVWFAIVLALVATMLISVPAGAAVTRITAHGGVLALVSGVTLGLSVVALDFAPAESGIFPAFLDVGCGLVLLLPLMAFRRARGRLAWLGESDSPDPAPTDAAPVLLLTPTRAAMMSAASGILLGVGNILLVVALHTGNLAVVAVLVSLYPLGTVLLARLVLGERLSRPQLGGVALAVVAAIMLGVS